MNKQHECGFHFRFVTEEDQAEFLQKLEEIAVQVRAHVAFTGAKVKRSDATILDEGVEKYLHYTVEFE